MRAYAEKTCSRHRLMEVLDHPSQDTVYLDLLVCVDRSTYSLAW